MISQFTDRNQIIAFGQRRGIMVPGASAQSIISSLRRWQRNGHFNKVRLQAFMGIFDAMERAKLGRNLARGGPVYRITTSENPFDRLVVERNPRKYFDVLMKEHEMQIALEEEFLRKFVTSNPGLTPPAKALMARTATVAYGPWHAKNHVYKVEQTEDETVTVFAGNIGGARSESFYYLYPQGHKHYFL